MKGYIPNDNLIKNLSDRHKYIIHKIYEGKLFDNTSGGFVPLYAKALKNIIGYKYLSIIQELIQMKIIERDNHYLPGDICKAFRLYEYYAKIKVFADEFTEKSIIRNLQRFKNPHYIPKTKRHYFLYNNLHKLEINHEKALEYIKNISAEEFEEIKKRKRKKKRKKSNEISLVEYQNLLEMSIDYIRDKKFFFKVDKKNGRVYNNATNLAKELRPFLRYNGQGLSNVDIANSQPFIFNKPIDDFILKNPLFFKTSLLNEVQTSIIQEHISKECIIPSYDSNIVINDIYYYKLLTSNGKFYNFLMEQENITNRDEFKKDFFGKVFFCKLNKKYKYQERKIFEKWFPLIAYIIDYFKKRDYKRLAYLLQKSESDIMIGKVIKRIADERPGIFCLTIHDSILTTEDNIDYVINIIQREFEKNLKIKPTLKVE